MKQKLDFGSSFSGADALFLGFVTPVLLFKLLPKFRNFLSSLGSFLDDKSSEPLIFLFQFANSLFQLSNLVCHLFRLLLQCLFALLLLDAETCRCGSVTTSLVLLGCGAGVHLQCGGIVGRISLSVGRAWCNGRIPMKAIRRCGGSEVQIELLRL